MKRMTYLTFVILAIMFLTSCTIHFPYDYEMTARQNKIVFRIIPEDALLLLNGKMIGEVYEFSTWESALSLSSKNNEIIVKRDGYIEEVIDLHEYSGREFIVKLNLKKAKEYKRKRIIIKKKQLEKKDVGIAVKPKELEKPETKLEKEQTLSKTSVSLMVKPAESAIYINKKFWGISPDSGKINLILKKGKYTIEIIKPGYKNVLKNIIISGNKKTLDLKFNLLISK